MEQKVELTKPAKRRIRVLTMRNVYEYKNSHFDFTGMWAEKVCPDPDDCGVWFIYGAEKNGKTTFALMLANYLRSMAKVLYISAEEGLRTPIRKACQLVGIPEDTTDMHMSDYLPIEDLWSKLRDRRSAKVIFIDNTTVYNEELQDKQFGLLKLMRAFPEKLFVIIGHEVKGEPYKAAAKRANQLASIIFHVQGLAAIVGGRVGENVGQKIPIIEERAKLYHGNDL